VQLYASRVQVECNYAIAILSHISLVNPRTMDWSYHQTLSIPVSQQEHRLSQTDVMFADLGDNY